MSPFTVTGAPFWSLKFPFEYKFTWLDGRYTAKLNEVKTNVPIDAARFGKPAAK